MKNPLCHLLHWFERESWATWEVGLITYQLHLDDYKVGCSQRRQAGIIRVYEELATLFKELDISISSKRDTNRVAVSSILSGADKIGAI
jgi:hypothetical protein